MIAVAAPERRLALFAFGGCPLRIRDNPFQHRPLRYCVTNCQSLQRTLCCSRDAVESVDLVEVSPPIRRLSLRPGDLSSAELRRYYGTEG
jgi:hypothetical protein